VLTLGDWKQTGLAVDVDGSILFARTSDLIRVRGSTLTTIASMPMIVAHIRIDADTGDYLASGLQNLTVGHMCRVDRTTYRITTIRQATRMFLRPVMSAASRWIQGTRYRTDGMDVHGFSRWSRVRRSRDAVRAYAQNDQSPVATM
jgi:hypothetical protein